MSKEDEAEIQGLDWQEEKFRWMMSQFIGKIFTPDVVSSKHSTNNIHHLEFSQRSAIYGDGWK